MNFGFLNDLPRIDFSNLKLGRAPNPIAAITESSKQLLSLDYKLLGLSLLSFIPWTVNVKEKSHLPATVNRKYQQQYRESRRTVESGEIVNRMYQQRYRESRRNVEPGEGVSVPPFRPYVAKVPWHGGARGFLSQMFPRYGHYCGPNWSSGKDGGSLLWDRRPIDWLDFCCYCHDIGYDTDDQAKLLKADLAFLECLERPRMSTKGDARVAYLYKTMCITGLKNILIPYRRQLTRLQEGTLPFKWPWTSDKINFSPFGWLGARKHEETKCHM